MSTARRKPSSLLMASAGSRSPVSLSFVSPVAMSSRRRRPSETRWSGHARAFEGAAAEHPAAARATSRGAGRDRARGGKHRASERRCRRADACRGPIPQQGARRRRHADSRKGAAGRRRSGRRRTALHGSGATLERGRGAVRGGAGASRPRGSAPCRRTGAAGRLGARGGSGDPGADRRCRDDAGRPARRRSDRIRAACRGAQRSFGSKATVGRWCSRDAPSTSETSRGCATSPGSWPNPARSSTCSTSSPRRPARMGGGGQPDAASVA